MSERIGKGLLALLFMAALFGAGFGIGEARANKWWLNRVTGREIPAPGSLLREELGSKVYCVSVSESERGFTAHPVKCEDAAHPVVKEVPPSPPLSETFKSFDRAANSLDKALDGLQASIMDLGNSMGLCWNEAKKDWFPCAPKPQKGKKPRIKNCVGCCEPNQPMKPNLSQPEPFRCLDGGFWTKDGLPCQQTVNPVQPIPEKEPLSPDMQKVKKECEVDGWKFEKTPGHWACRPPADYFIPEKEPEQESVPSRVLIDGKWWTVAVTEDYLDLSGPTGKISTRVLPHGVLYQGENGECPKDYIPNNWASTTFVYAYCYPPRRVQQ